MATRHHGFVSAQEGTDVLVAEDYSIKGLIWQNATLLTPASRRRVSVIAHRRREKE